LRSHERARARLSVSPPTSPSCRGCSASPQGVVQGVIAITEGIVSQRHLFDRDGRGAVPLPTCLILPRTDTPSVLFSRLGCSARTPPCRRSVATLLTRDEAGASLRTSPSCRSCCITGPRLGHWTSLVQRPQNPSPHWSHRVENSICLGVAGIGLNGIPAVNDFPVFYKHGISTRMPAIPETNTSHPGPALERVYPTKSRYSECVVGCPIFEGAFEVIGDEFVIARVRSRRRHVFAW
jgi:hypothetical protein